jgi:hypothetical protein
MQMIDDIVRKPSVYVGAFSIKYKTLGMKETFEY